MKIFEIYKSKKTVVDVGSDKPVWKLVLSYNESHGYKLTIYVAPDRIAELSAILTEESKTGFNKPYKFFTSSNAISFFEGFREKSHLNKDIFLQLDNLIKLLVKHDLISEGFNADIQYYFADALRAARKYVEAANHLVVAGQEYDEEREFEYLSKGWASCKTIAGSIEAGYSPKSPQEFITKLNPSQQAELKRIFFNKIECLAGLKSKDAITALLFIKIEEACHSEVEFFKSLGVFENIDSLRKLYNSAEEVFQTNGQFDLSIYSDDPQDDLSWEVYTYLNSLIDEKINLLYLQAPTANSDIHTFSDSAKTLFMLNQANAFSCLLPAELMYIFLDFIKPQKGDITLQANDADNFQFAGEQVESDYLHKFIPE